MKSGRRHCAPKGMRLLPVIAFSVFFAASCGSDDRAYVANIGNGDESPTMTTYEVETFISDSGYTRYHISTPVWKMFEEAAEPFWRFPDGLDLQQYDLEMNPAATMECDSAVYYSRKRLWRLDGHVMMVNTLRDTFLSQQLFWDQAKRQVYTDSFIHIVRSDRIIEGYGFESNENMTAYTINHPTAILPVQRRVANASVVADTALTDSVVPVVNRRRAPVRPQSGESVRPGTDSRKVDTDLRPAAELKVNGRAVDKLKLQSNEVKK